ncbi:MAG: proton-conducting transporter membrane subunit, partial [Bacteroidota bacterium]
FKNVLFMAAGSVRRRAHTLNMDTLGGLVHGMPKTTALFLVASVAACGLPPLNAFMSEFLLYNGLLKGLSAGNVSVDMILLLAIITLVLAGGLAIYAFTQVGGVTFLGYPRTEQAANAVETDSIMLWPQYILVAIMLSIGLLPGFWFRLIAEVAETALHGTLKITGKYYARAEDIGLAGGLFIVFILVLYIIRSSRVKVNTVRRGDPWACGYLAVNTRMQYTATGFADYFAKLTKAIVGVKQVYKPIPRLEIFPDERKFEIQSYDTVRTNFVSRGGEMLRKALDKAAVIQTGQVQSYILYACIFLVTMFLLTLFNFI